MWTALSHWLNTAPVLVLGIVALMLMALAGAAGIVIRKRQNRLDAAAGIEHDDGFEGYVVSAVLGLLALLLGFTFSMAVDRFDARRGLVLEEANAIGTTYLRSQLLEEPHRARISGLLVAYTDNRIALGKAGPDQVPPLLASNDRIIRDLWTATSAAFPTIQNLDFSSAYLESMNHLIDLDTSRKVARTVRVPPEVFVILFIYMFVTAGVMGYVLVGPRGRISGGFMLLLLTMALMLIFDIDRPARGGIMESQMPMEYLRGTLKSWPPATFDRWRGDPAPQPQSRPVGEQRTPSG